MNKLLLATVLCALAAPAYATTAYHVGATSDGGPGSDPNPIASNTSFFIADNPNKAEAGPLTIYFAVPEGEADPTISKITYNGGTTGLAFTAPVELTALGDFTGSPTKDLYTFVGCVACDNSLNFVNFSAGIAADTTLSSVPTAYDVFKAVVTVDFAGKDFIDVMGSFAEGTYIAPLSGTDVDTSFTNVGLITGSAVINPTGSPVPEPSTWVMMGTGFALMGLVGWKRRSRYAIG